MAGIRPKHLAGKLGLMPRIIRFLCVAAFLLTSVPGVAVPASAAAAPATGAMVAGMSMVQPCQAKAVASMRASGASQPLAVDPCCADPFACSSCTSFAASLLPSSATLLPGVLLASADFMPGFYHIPHGQAARPNSPPPRRLV